jgi:hypothetical protein
VQEDDHSKVCDLQVLAEKGGRSGHEICSVPFCELISEVSDVFFCVVERCKTRRSFIVVVPER